MKMTTIYPKYVLDQLKEIDKMIVLQTKNSIPDEWKEPKTASNSMFYTVDYVERVRREIYEKCSPLYDLKAQIMATSPVSYVIELEDADRQQK